MRDSRKIVSLLDGWSLLRSTEEPWCGTALANLIGPGGVRAAGGLVLDQARALGGPLPAAWAGGETDQKQPSFDVFLPDQTGAIILYNMIEKWTFNKKAHLEKQLEVL